MAIAHVFQHHFKHIVVMGLITLLVACGGGGSSSKDTKPDSFSFTSVTGAAVSTDVTSSAITVAGINKETAISISGGSYSINDGAFTATAGTVTSGQNVKVKVTSSSTTNTPVVATLTIGGVAGTFTVTTAPDTTPNAFTFTALTGAVISSVNIFNTVTVSGFDVPVAISIVGGEYKIDSGAFISTPGTISSGQTVTVRTTAATTVNTNVTATLTIGGVTGTYTVTTFADTVAPTAQIMFPPAVSMSDGTTVKIRGTAHDDYSSISSVTVNGVAAVSTDNFATWTATVPLTVGANTVTVVTTDSASNSNSDAAHVSVQRVADVADTSTHFPDATHAFSNLGSFVLDSTRNRFLVADRVLKEIVAVDMSTGVRGTFSGGSIPDANNSFDIPSGVTLDLVHNRIFVSDYGTTNRERILAVDLASGVRTLISQDSVFHAILDIAFDSTHNQLYLTNYLQAMLLNINLSTGAATVLSDNHTPNTNNPLSTPDWMALDVTNNRALISDWDVNGILSVSLSTGERTVLSGANVPDANNAFLSPRGIALDSANNRALVVDTFLNAIISVNLSTGARTVISGSVTIDESRSTNQPNANVSFQQIYGAQLDASHNVLYVADNTLHALFSVDAITGERVIFSK